MNHNDYKDAIILFTIKIGLLLIMKYLITMIFKSINNVVDKYKKIFLIWGLSLFSWFPISAWIDAGYKFQLGIITSWWFFIDINCIIFIICALSYPLSYDKDK